MDVVIWTEQLVSNAGVDRQLGRKAKIVLHKSVPVVTLDDAIIRTALVEAARLADQVVCKRIGGHGAVESEEAVGRGGGTIDHFRALILSPEFHRVAAAEPAHVVPELIDVSVLDVVQTGVQVEVAVDGHLRKLGWEHAG